MLGDGLRDLVDPRSSRSYFPKNKKKRKKNSTIASDNTGQENLLEIEKFTVDFLSDSGKVRAVSDVSFSIKKGEIVGLVGESASGKSTLAMSMLKLLPPNAEVVSGSIRFQNLDVLEIDQEKMRNIRGKSMTYVTQDALAAMNPMTRVEEQITEILKDHGVKDKKVAKDRALELLRLVRLKDPERNLRNYPHELSGGMQQRVIIAQSLALRPELLIADEPTTALDVSVQAGILELIKGIRRDYGTSIVFITHDLAIVAELCDRVAVMYAGSIVEVGDVDEIFTDPKHPYTQALVGGLLPLRGESKGKLGVLEGQPPRTGEWPSGCTFHPRCYLYEKLGKPERCTSDQPANMDNFQKSWASCHFTEARSKLETIISVNGQELRSISFQ